MRMQRWLTIQRRRKRTLYLILAATVLVFLSFSLKIGAKKTINETLVASFAPSPTPTIIPTPTNTPTPTATPIPTVTPTPTYTGFCIQAPVLMYHHIENMAKATADGHAGLTVSPEFFDSQMKYLIDSGYKIISADELIGDLFNNTRPGKVAVITLDDGYEDNWIIFVKSSIFILP